MSALIIVCGAATMFFLAAIILYMFMIRLLYVAKVVLIEDREIQLTEKQYDSLLRRETSSLSIDTFLLLPLVGDFFMLFVGPLFLFQIFSKWMLKEVRTRRQEKESRRKLMEKANNDPGMLAAIEEVNKLLKQGAKQ
jgi:hypothetical protein